VRVWLLAGLLLAVCGHAQAQIVAAVLPSSRSVAVGHTATAYATIINAGTTAATGCAIALPTGISATFSYQTTNPATNSVSGTVNTPATIAAGSYQTFVVAVTPTAAFASTDIALQFTCTGLDPAPTLSGINTLLLTASSTALPDIVALVATTSGNGTVSLPSATGAAAFAVATVNLGSTGSITVSADTNGVAVPVTVTLCQTVPSTGACIGTPASTVTVSIAANATPTFGIFVTGTDNVAALPGANRISVRFSSGGTVVGSTSVAVQTTGYTAPSTSPLTFSANAPSTGTTGVAYNFCYCAPTPSGANGLCGSPTQSNPAGGHPPYHFQLGSGVGFPPSGVVLGLNGCLTGTPVVSGTKSFSVCAIDLNGSQICNPTSVTVNAGVGTTTTVEIGGDVATQAVITLDGATIKAFGDQNLDYYAQGLSIGNHTLVFSCPGAQSYCFATISFSPGTGFSVSPTSISLPYPNLPANSSVTKTFTLTKP
jgi:hypothetical protein